MAWTFPAKRQTIAMKQKAQIILLILLSLPFTMGLSDHGARVTVMCVKSGHTEIGGGTLFAWLIKIRGTGNRSRAWMRHWLIREIGPKTNLGLHHIDGICVFLAQISWDESGVLSEKIERWSIPTPRQVLGGIGIDQFVRT